MAYSESQVCITLPAAVDMSAMQYRFVVVDSSGEAGVPGDGDNAVGILQNKPAAGQAAQVCISGVSKAVAGAAIAAGAQITCQDDGDAKTSASGLYRLGIALGAASAASEVISVLVQKNGQV